MTDSKIIPILNYEEGYKESPYLDTLGYPTVAGGIRIGPKGASLSNYTFRVPRTVGDAWKQVIVDQKANEMSQRPSIAAAINACNPPRRDVLISMAYQMGVDGLAGFKNTLKLIADGNFIAAADGMLNSLWAKQTPNRAKRHADVMRTGSYDIYRGLI
ncbi:glycoside hydrolase family protein [Klebsiella pneumoniae]|uniref:glycoside hydrolase family protein n=1 Tax=Enterobacterales TaxID=91347 RepID=UPI000E5CDBA8|nr:MULTISPECIES: glycoside hydrolase family protein [Enterobacterales]MDN2606802.1 glycoside hydrolase family protein [Klebsiella variicola]MDU4748295.1 glycoside hydrolase family protein [Pantoea sp.]AXZ12060.1 lysozyme [Klebsiella pneumoniae]MCQ5472516.1 glycoside hydrolase family protein [Pantoea brenneri]MCS5752365.1 glycoside hydrolase family protein [Klebsiella quasipneumoniae subsp. quasipneumoniae]